MKILAIDTSGMTCTVAVSSDGMLMSQFSIQFKTTHSQILMPMINDIKEKINLDLNSVDAIAIANGPGSFTGLRIGLATAKALCLALDKPLIQVPTLDAMAMNFYGTDKIVCPMMDARRMQVYTGVYEFVEKKDDDFERSYDFRVVKEQEALSLEEIVSVLNGLNKEVILLGDAIPVYKDKIKELLKVPYTCAPLMNNRQNAASLSFIAEQYYKEGKAILADDASPTYLRPSQAERTAADKTNLPKTAIKTGLPERVFIRLMTEKDLDSAAYLEQSNLGKEAWTRSQLENAMNREDTIYLVAEKNKEIVGLCGVQNISGDGEITNVSVSDKCRNEGIGSKMLHQLLERGKGIGIENYTLEVRSNNMPAIKLYEKLHFVSEGIRPGFYDQPKDDAVIYWLRK